MQEWIKLLMVKNIKKNLPLLIFIFLVLYFCFNFLSGERGLISFYEKKKILNDLKAKEISLINKIKDLEFKNSLLSDNIDLDYVEILIRERFLLGKKNEKIYLIENNDTEN